ncbi:unnamed protein product [Amoebophrya sp. A25]|nr:unnamed protein product [Amoebophrya sp. A25]|eukprot:GSA25T00012957001.1
MLTFADTQSSLQWTSSHVYALNPALTYDLSAVPLISQWAARLQDETETKAEGNSDVDTKLMYRGAALRDSLSAHLQGQPARLPDGTEIPLEWIVDESCEAFCGGKTQHFVKDGDEELKWNKILEKFEFVVDPDQESVQAHYSSKKLQEFLLDLETEDGLRRDDPAIKIVEGEYLRIEYVPRPLDAAAPEHSHSRPEEEHDFWKKWKLGQPQAAGALDLFFTDIGRENVDDMNTECERAALKAGFGQLRISEESPSRNDQPSRHDTASSDGVKPEKGALVPYPYGGCWVEIPKDAKRGLRPIARLLLKHTLLSQRNYFYRPEDHRLVLLRKTRSLVLKERRKGEEGAPLPTSNARTSAPYYRIHINKRYSLDDGEHLAIRLGPRYAHAQLRSQKLHCINWTKSGRKASIRPVRLIRLSELQCGQNLGEKISSRVVANGDINSSKHVLKNINMFPTRTWVRIHQIQWQRAGPAPILQVWEAFPPTPDTEDMKAEVIVQIVEGNGLFSAPGLQVRCGEYAPGFLKTIFGYDKMKIKKLEQDGNQECEEPNPLELEELEPFLQLQRHLKGKRVYFLGHSSGVAGALLLAHLFVPSAASVRVFGTGALAVDFLNFRLVQNLRKSRSSANDIEDHADAYPNIANVDPTYAAEHQPLMTYAKKVERVDLLVVEARLFFKSVVDGDAPFADTVAEWRKAENPSILDGSSTAPESEKPVFAEAVAQVYSRGKEETQRLVKLWEAHPQHVNVLDTFLVRCKKIKSMEEGINTSTEAGTSGQESDSAFFNLPSPPPKPEDLEKPLGLEEELASKKIFVWKLTMPFQGEWEQNREKILFVGAGHFYTRLVKLIPIGRFPFAEDEQKKEHDGDLFRVQLKTAFGSARLQRLDYRLQLVQLAIEGVHQLAAYRDALLGYVNQHSPFIS